MLKEHFEGIQKALTKEVKEMKEIFEQMEAEVNQNSVDKKSTEIERKNLLIENENLIVDSLSKDVFYTATDSMLTNPIGKKCTLGVQCPLTRFTKSKVVPLKKPENVSTSETVIPERFSNTSQKPLTRYQRKNKQEKATSTGIPTIAETQTTASSVKYTSVVHIVLWYLDSGCSKHMTGNRSWLMNFVKKFIGTIRFGNDHFGAITGYRDYVIGDSMISRVYYVEGLGHNLFSVGQFCD
ncbi:hypothetical protein Tco_0866600 [Tanacetum coccineum]